MPCIIEGRISAMAMSGGSDFFTVEPTLNGENAELESLDLITGIMLTFVCTPRLLKV